MRFACNSRSAAFVGTAVVASAMLLVWFAVIVYQAQTRGQHRRAYQQLTGEIMVPMHADGRRNTSRHLNARQDKSPLAVAQQ